MVARDVDNTRALARLSQELLHDIVVRLRPVPGRLQCPAVDNVTDQIDRFSFVIAEEVEKLVGLATACSEVNVGDEQRAKSSRGAPRHDTTISDAVIMRDM
jgi:hypothetical protein